MSVLPLIAALFAVPQFVPQLARLWRTGDASGVSSAWAAGILAVSLARGGELPRRTAVSVTASKDDDFLYRDRHY